MAMTETATLGGGCFWCLEAVYLGLQGVQSVMSGYAGGHLPNPTYKQVCNGNTGHAEVVQVVFDPAEASYADLLRVFFTIHDPTTKDRQENDVGTQYRSAIWAQSPEQAQIAERVKTRVDRSGKLEGPVVTQIIPAMRFFAAEDYHQDYLVKHPDGYNCHFVRKIDF